MLEIAHLPDNAMEIENLTGPQKLDLANAIAMYLVSETTQSSFADVFGQLGIQTPSAWTYTEDDDLDEVQTRQLELYQQAEQLLTDQLCLKYEVALEVNDADSIDLIRTAAPHIWRELEDLDDLDEWDSFVSGVQEC